MTSTWLDLSPAQRQAIADGWTAFLHSPRGELYAQVMAKVNPDARYEAGILESQVEEFLHELAANAGWTSTGEVDVTGRAVMRPNPARAERDAVRRAVEFRAVNDAFHYAKQLQLEIDVDAVVPQAYRVPEGRNCFNEPEYEQAGQVVHAWLRRFQAGGTSRGLLWQGMNGSGKSTMMGEVARSLLRARIPVAWIEPHDLHYRLAESRDGGAEIDLLERYSETRAICLNDLGSEKKNDAVARFLCRLLEQAIGQGQAVLAGTNLTAPQLVAHFGHDEWGREQLDVGERLTSRLVGATELVAAWPMQDLRGM